MKAAFAWCAAVAFAACFTVALYHLLRWAAGLRAPAVQGPDADALADPELRRLEDEQRRLVQALREVQFDHATGKIDAADRDRLRARYEREAAAVMAELDRRKAY
jgi:hypothetical protein